MSMGAQTQEGQSQKSVQMNEISCKCQIFQKGNDKNEVTASVPSYSSSTCSVPSSSMSSSLVAAATRGMDVCENGTN